MPRFLIALILAGMPWAVLGQDATPPVPVPPAECRTRVGYDRDREMPGYILPTSAGKRTCIPFSNVAELPPPGYVGDFYVEEFGDEKLRARWEKCKEDEECRERVGKQIHARRPPNKEFHLKDRHRRHLLGKNEHEEADEHEEDEEREDAKKKARSIDLEEVRRPAFFATEPWGEPFAALDSHTSTVEFTAPRDPHERIHKKMKRAVKIRGWYVRGDGVDVGRAGRVRALVVMTPGGGGRIAAITHPGDRLYRVKEDGETKINDYPNERSGATGQQLWRAIAHRFHRSGFDVLLYDRRGVGISTGYSDTNTLQQGRDLLAMVASLRSGEGLRAFSPAGGTTEGAAAAVAVRGGPTNAELPVLLFGNSRGTMASGWAMTINFDKDCTYDLPEIECRPAVNDRSIKGAIMLAEFTSGPGFVMDQPSKEDEERGLGRDRTLFIAGNAVENNLVFFPSSAILGGIHKWPAAFFGRGLWDYAASLQGTIESYRRVNGPKELVVVRAPHPYEVWPESERKRVQDRFIAFATAVVRGKKTIPGGRPWTNMKELVATSSDVWEKSTRPTLVP